MGEWAKKAFGRLREYEGHEHDENQRHALERHQVMADAPVRWQELIASMETEIEAWTACQPRRVRPRRSQRLLQDAGDYRNHPPSRSPPGGPTL